MTISVLIGKIQEVEPTDPLGRIKWMPRLQFSSVRWSNATYTYGLVHLCNKIYIYSSISFGLGSLQKMHNGIWY